MDREALFTGKKSIDFAGVLFETTLFVLEVGLVCLQHELEVGVVKFELKGVVKHHEHDECKVILTPEV